MASDKEKYFHSCNILFFTSLMHVQIVQIYVSFNGQCGEKKSISNEKGNACVLYKLHISFCFLFLNLFCIQFSLFFQSIFRNIELFQERRNHIECTMKLNFRCINIFYVFLISLQKGKKINECQYLKYLFNHNSFSYFLSLTHFVYY